VKVAVELEIELRQSLDNSDTDLETDPETTLKLTLKLPRNVSGCSPIEPRININNAWKKRNRGANFEDTIWLFVKSDSRVVCECLCQSGFVALIQR